MSTYSDIKKLQQSAEIDDYINFYVFRKISILFSIIFVKLRFSANFVTFLGFLADIFAIYLMYIDQWLFAGIMVIIALIWDSSDGEVARYNRLKIKNPPKTKYGGYLDEILGTVSFALVIFFAGYFIGNFWLGFIAMFGLLITMVGALGARIEFKDQKKISKKFEEKIFGKLKGRIGFNCAIQRILVSLAIIFSSQIILLIFAVLINLFWLLKLWTYRKS
jgi:phosphatidylglycerophosphate synthase